MLVYEVSVCLTCSSYIGVVLCPHHFVHLVAYIAKDVVEELGCAFAGGHTHDHAEVDVLALLGDILSAHELFDLEELSQVEILL
jgi:hypothetical protein